jgi:hypothetical protein
MIATIRFYVEIEVKDEEDPKINEAIKDIENGKVSDYQLEYDDILWDEEEAIDKGPIIVTPKEQCTHPNPTIIVESEGTQWEETSLWCPDCGKTLEDE